MMTRTQRLTRLTGQLYICDLKPELQQIVPKLQQLRKLGQTDAQILGVIKKMDLPLGLHLALTGRYSDLMEAK